MPALYYYQLRQWKIGIVTDRAARTSEHQRRKVTSTPCIYGDALASCLERAFGNAAHAPQDCLFDALLKQLDRQETKR